MLLPLAQPHSHRCGRTFDLNKFPGDLVARRLCGMVRTAHRRVVAPVEPRNDVVVLVFRGGLGRGVHPFSRRMAGITRPRIFGTRASAIAGNCNGDTIRGFPVVTEICVQYVREAKLPDETGTLLPLKSWLRAEWLRSGLPLSKTNEACGVANAATRKYFTQCHMWYFPPPDKMVALARYAAEHGLPTRRPYFSIDGKTPLSEAKWASMRSKWNHAHGITNVRSGLRFEASSASKARDLSAFT